MCHRPTLGMLTVRIFSQFSFQFSFQFSIENESKIKSKIEGSMKMNLHGTFSWKAQFLFHFWVPFFTLGFILRFKFEGNDAPGWWHMAFGVWAACFFSYTSCSALSCSFVMYNTTSKFKYDKHWTRKLNSCTLSCLTVHGYFCCKIAYRGWMAGEYLQ